jgi:hypothetical protein
MIRVVRSHALVSLVLAGLVALPTIAQSHQRQLLHVEGDVRFEIRATTKSP